MNPRLNRFLEEPGGHVLLDPDLRIEDLGPQFARMNLTSRENLTGKFLFDVIYSDEKYLNQIKESIDKAKATKIPDKIGPLRVWVKPLPGESGKAQQRWWSFAAIPVGDGYVAERVEDHTTEMVAFKAITAQRISNYILYFLCIILLISLAYVGFHDESSISKVSKITCVIQARSLPAQHHLSKTMQDFSELLLVPPQSPVSSSVKVIVNDAEYHLQKYVQITRGQPFTRSCK